MSSDDLVFTVDQVAACRTAMRTALALPPEHVTTARLIGTISAAIAQLRVEGWADAEIAALVAESTGSVVTDADLAAHFRSPAPSDQS